MNRIFNVLAAALLAAGCKNAGGDVMMNPLNGAWNKNKAQVYTFEVKDAQQPKNIIFVIRNNNDYPFSNIRIISSLKQYKGRFLKKDTLNFILAKPNGEWIGKGFGDTKEAEVQYKLNFRFPANGHFRLEVLQAMRKDNLPGIEDFGIKIENAKP